MKSTLKVPGSKRLKLEQEKLLSNFAFNFNLRRYIKGNNPAGMGDQVDFDKLEWEGAITAGRCRLNR
jgi:hypothetical protein